MSQQNYSTGSVAYSDPNCTYDGMLSIDTTGRRRRRGQERGLVFAHDGAPTSRAQDEGTAPSGSDR